MEVTQHVPWLDTDHPNYERWKRGRELSAERGKFVRALLQKQINPVNLSILDLGSGEGGTSYIFSENNFVVSLDISLIRLKRQNQDVISIETSGSKSSKTNREKVFASPEIVNQLSTAGIPKVNGSALVLPFANNSFDLIILQDVIEHIDNTEILSSELNRVLVPGGMIYLSTPNRYSLFNIISDPHWGMPFLALFKRNTIRNFYLKNFRKHEIERKDIAELLPLNSILKLFGNNFEMKLNTTFAVDQLMKGNKGIVWSNFHLSLLKLVSFLKLDKLILLAANDKSGIVNKYLTPTFYITLKKI